MATCLLQVQRYLTLALEAAYQVGEKPLSSEVVESVLSRQIDDLEPTLTRNGYRLKRPGGAVRRPSSRDQGAFQQPIRPNAGSGIARQNVAGRITDMNTVNLQLI